MNSATRNILEQFFEEYMNSYEYILSYLEVELLSHRTYVSSALIATASFPKSFSKVQNHFTLPPVMSETNVFSTSLSTLGIVCLLHLAILVGILWNAFVFNFNFLDD